MLNRFQTSLICPKIISLGTQSLLLTCGIVAIVFSVSSTAFADTLNYPWPTDTEAPCEFAPNGGSSCANPNNPSGDLYDWGVYASGVFQPYRNGYEYRNCTDYTQWKESTEQVSVPTNWGNGGQWYGNAPTNEQSTTPKAWDAAVVPGNPGHVAFVESVNSDGTITVSEYNHDVQGHGDTRTGTASSMGFTKYVDFGVHPSGGTSSTPRLSALQYGSSEMDAYKLASNGTISKDTYQSSSGSWSGWSSMGTPFSGGTFTSDPVAIQFNSEMDVYALGSDGHVYKNTWQPSPGSWSGWNSMGGTNLAGRPAATKYSGSEMDIFSRGTNGNLYRDYWNGTSWSGFNQLSGNGSTAMASDPSVTLYGSEMDVYIRGTDSNLWKSGGYGGSSIGSLGSMGGGNLENNPMAIQYGSEMDIYSNNTSGTLIKDVWNGSSWSGWSSLTGQSFSGSPAAMQYGSGELDVYDRGISDTHIYKNTWQSGGSSWSGWNSLGGLESGDPTAIQFSTEMDVFATNGSSNTDKDTWLPANNSWSGFLGLL